MNKYLLSLSLSLLGLTFSAGAMDSGTGIDPSSAAPASSSSSSSDSSDALRAVVCDPNARFVYPHRRDLKFLSVQRIVSRVNTDNQNILGYVWYVCESGLVTRERSAYLYTQGQFKGQYGTHTYNQEKPNQLVDAKHEFNALRRCFRDQNPQFPIDPVEEAFLAPADIAVAGAENLPIKQMQALAIAKNDSLQK